MPIIVEIDMYSGRPNPSWELDALQAKKLVDLLQSRKSSTSLGHTETLGQLGYRGVMISSIGEASVPRSARLFDGVYHAPGLAVPPRIDSDSVIEKFLLETGRGRMSARQTALVTDAVEKNVKGGVNSVLRNMQLLAAPPFDSGKWNNDAAICRSNNCYNYANDTITNSFAQPGRGSGQEGPYPPGCAGTGQAAQRDGQIPVANPNQTFAQGHLIALVISSSWEDYHWYRRDSNNMWSHKPGRTPARNTDNSNSSISSPETCDRGPYEQFCGYFQCIPSQVRIL